MKRDVNDTLREQGNEAVRARHDKAEHFKSETAEEDRRSDTGNVHSFRQRDEDAAADGVTLEHFHAYMPQHSYIFAPTREMWPSASVNARIPPVLITENGKEKAISAAAWLDKNRSVEQMTWAPGKPMIIADRLVSDGGWIERQGVACFNLYRPPTIPRGDPNQANLWLNLVEQIFPNDFKHIIHWFAHRVQHPEDKINHALVLGGARASARTPSLNRSSTRSDRGIFTKCRRRR